MLQTYFNKVLVLNQESRPDRWAQFELEAKRIGLKATRFLSIPDEQPYLSFCNSQLAMVRSVENEGSVLTLEDDAIFTTFAHFDEAFHELPPDWDILYLGANVLKHEPYSKHLRRIIHGWTTHAVAYRNTAIKKIIADYKGHDPNGMYDDWLSREVLPVMKAYVIAPMIAWQREGFSDLWNCRTSYGWMEIEKRLI